METTARYSRSVYATSASTCGFRAHPRCCGRRSRCRASAAGVRPGFEVDVLADVDHAALGQRFGIAAGGDDRGAQHVVSGGEARVRIGRARPRRPRRASHFQSARDLVRRRCRAPLRRRHHLAASARLARRPTRSDRGCRSRCPRRRHARLQDAWRRACRGRAAPAHDLHARGRRLRPQPAQSGASGGRRVGARSRQRRHRRHAQLHRWHDRQIQGRAPPSPRAELFRHRDPRRLRNSRRSALPRGRPDQPRHRHEGPARADEGRDRAHAQGF